MAKRETLVKMAMESLAIVTASLVVGLTVLLVLLDCILSPSMHTLEPPVLKPRVPFIGHAITMFREKAGFYSRVL